jgi:hypothetical protein
MAGIGLGLAVAQIVVGRCGGEVVRRLVGRHDGLQSLTRGRCSDRGGKLFEGADGAPLMTSPTPVHSDVTYIPASCWVGWAGQRTSTPAPDMELYLVLMNRVRC